MPKRKKVIEGYIQEGWYLEFRHDVSPAPIVSHTWIYRRKQSLEGEDCKKVRITIQEI